MSLPPEIFLPHGLVVRQRIAALVDIAEFHRLADGDGPAIGLLRAGDHAKQVVLPAPFGPMTPTMPPGGNLNDRLSIKSLSWNPLERFSKSMTLAPSRSGDGDDDLRAGRALVAGLLDEFVIALDARLVLGLPCLGRGADPVLLGSNRLLAGGILARFLGEALVLGRQPACVIALIGDARAAIELQNPARHIVEEVAVMGDDEDRARIFAQVVFQPVDGFGVEMVGRLVQQQQIGLSSSNLQSATRRRSPPESLSTAQSSGGQRSASMACSTLLSRSHRFSASMMS